MVFEAMELLAPDEVVIGCSGRLVRSFPSRAASVARNLVLEDIFQEPFVHVLTQLRTVDRYPSKHVEQILVYDPRDPVRTMTMVMAVLRGVGHCMIEDIPYIYKHSRNEVIQPKPLTSDGKEYKGSRDKRLAWRRSPLWLLIRVALHIRLDRRVREGGVWRSSGSLYKAFMIFLLSSVLERAALVPVSDDLLSFMSTKIKRRMLKLGSVDQELWCRSPSDVMHRVDSALNKHWEAVQSPQRQTLELSGFAKLDFEQDTVLSLEALRPHLARVRARQGTGPWETGIRGFPFHRSGHSKPPGGMFKLDQSITYFELADFERWAQSNAFSYMSSASGTRAILAPDQNQAKQETATKNSWNRNFVAGITSTSTGYFSSAFGNNSGPRNKQGGKAAWQYSVDNSFARDVWADVVGVPSESDGQETRRQQKLCDECKSICVMKSNFEMYASPGELRSKIAHCDLCSMVWRVLWPSETSYPLWPVRLYRRGSNIWADGYDDQPVLRLCIDPSPSVGVEVQVGPPTLLDRLSPAYFKLLSTWLHDCDGNHQYNGCRTKDQLAISQLPLRVIDVGDDDGSVRLLCTQGNVYGQFAALSHRWGEPTVDDKRRNCTLLANLADRCRSIDFSALGKTFQDAITVTRGLGLRYLWIDSLCIIQDDNTDWQCQARLMEDIFTSAYCVIAATAADSTNSGFLKRDGAQTQFVSLPIASTPSGAASDSTHTSVYLCDSVPNFTVDVSNAGLSSRGWVLQERTLACRTIHFSANQTYLECGRGIRCESLGLLVK
jgi:hypothetical protein